MRLRSLSFDGTRQGSANLTMELVAPASDSCYAAAVSLCTVSLSCVRTSSYRPGAYGFCVRSENDSVSQSSVTSRSCRWLVSLSCNRRCWFLCAYVSMGGSGVHSFVCTSRSGGGCVRVRCSYPFSFRVRCVLCVRGLVCVLVHCSSSKKTSSDYW